MTGLGIALAFLSSFGIGFPSVVVWVGVGIVLLARDALSRPAFVAIAMASALGAAWAVTSSSSDTSVLRSGGFEGVVTVREGPYLTRVGHRYVVSGSATGGARVCVYADGATGPPVGDRLNLVGRMLLPEDMSEIGVATLGAWNCTAQLHAEEVETLEAGQGILTTLSRTRVRLSNYLMQVEPGDTGSLLSGLVTGEDGGLTNETSDAFLESGTTHITAISGANFALLVVLLSAFARGSAQRSVWFIAIATGVIWAYAIMVGLQPSALRAALLATAVLVGKWMGRRPDLLTLTLLLATLQILVRPHDFRTLAFQLSLAATIALIVVFDGSERGGDASRVETLVLAVVAAQLATIPIIAMQLGTVSATGLFANVVVSPLAAMTFPIALLGGMVGLVVPWLAEVLLLPAIWLGELTIAFVNGVSERLPGQVQLGAPVPAATAVIALACWGSVVALSGDLRRWWRHALQHVRNW